ncbi:MAG: O-antigen ligase family protein [Candidatus Hydrogenedentes bacterium]|nr:O-antigen ligase family protein [Candidatus Hydrogenedentota bacterium]
MRSLRGGCVAATLALLPLVYSFKFTSFLHAKEALLDVALVLCVLLRLIEARTPQRASRAGRPLLPLWLWLLWALAAAAMHSVQVSSYTVEEGVRIAVLLLFAGLNGDLLADRRWRRRIFSALILGGTLAAALGGAQFAGLFPALFPGVAGYDQPMYSVFGNQGLLGGYLALILPLVLWRYHTAPRIARLLLLVAAAIMGAAWGLSGARSAWLAGTLGIGLTLWLLRRRRWRCLAPAGVGILSAIAMLLITWTTSGQRLQHTLESSDVGGRARLWFWDAALRMTGEHPIAGVGLGNFPYWSPYYQGLALQAHPGHFHNELHTEHAHSEALEVLAETGCVGLLLALWLLWRVPRRPGPAVGTLSALMIVSLFNAALHSAPHALAGLFLAISLCMRPKASASESPPVPREVRGWPGPVAAFLAAMLLVAAHFATTLLPSYYLCAAEDAHLAGNNADALYQRALAHPWPNYPAREGYGMWLLEAQRPAEARIQFEAALRGLDTGRIHLLLALAAQRLGDHAAMQAHLEACLLRWPGNAQAVQLLQQQPLPPPFSPLF